MRSNIAIWWLLTAFFFLCAVIYVIWGLLYYQHVEWVGTIALIFSGFMGGMIAFFVQRVYKAQQGLELPEDVETADIDDGEMEQGEFSPWSWWPLLLASAVAIGAIALATAHFLIPICIGLLIVSLFGWVFEYYRGNFAR